MALAVALVLTAGCVSSGTKIRGVYFTGNRHVEDTRLLEGMYARPDSPLPWSDAHRYDPQEFERDRARVVAMLAQNGYPNASVKRAIAVAASDDEVNLYFDIDEGPPARVASVEVTGAPAGSGIDASTLPLQIGDVFVHARFLEGKQRIGDLLHARGYYRAEVTGRAVFPPDLSTARIKFTIEPGPLVHFGKTTVDGATAVPAADILDRVAWYEGDVYDPELVALTERRLLALGRFGSVYLEPSNERSDSGLAMKVHVVEAKRFELRLGGGFETDPVSSEVRVRTGMTVRGFPFTMTTLKLDGQLAPTFLVSQAAFLGYQYKLSALAEHEDVLVPRLRFTNEFDYSQQVTQAYTLQGPRAQLALDRSFWRDRIALGVGWQIRYQDVTALSAAVSGPLVASLGLESPYLDASYFQTLSLDLRDNPLETRRGFFADANVQEGGGGAGGHFDFVKVTPEVRGYLPLGGSTVLAARARLGLAFSNGGPLPVTERYFAGGPSSQRGFAQQQLAPFAIGSVGSGVPIGGEALLDSSIESRFDLTRWHGNWLQLAAFLDGADVTAERSQLDLFHLHWAAGTGLRYQTPVGPVRLDFAYRLNRTGAREPQANQPFNAMIALGEAF